MKNLLLIKYSDMRIGGIQKIIYSYIQYYKKNGYVCIWLAPDFYDIDKGFTDIINANEIYIFNKKQSFNYIKNNNFDNIIFLAFSIAGYYDNEMIRRKLKLNQIKSYFIIPNLIGNGVKIENNNKEHSIMADIYSKMYKNGSIVFCNKTQEDAFIEHYMIKLNDFQSNVIPEHDEEIEIDRKIIQDRFKKNDIITVTRFDFPHKAYLFGLIKTFKELKNKYPESKLRIIGYGNGLPDIMRNIDSLPQTIKKDIIFEGEVSYNDLKKFFIKGKVFVGLAGAAYEAVKSGLPTIIVRHYSYDCDSYGFYNEAPTKIISTAPGHDVMIDLERIFSASTHEYIDICNNEIKAVNNYINKTQMEFIDRMLKKEDILTIEELNKLQSIISHYSIKTKIKRNINYLKNPIKTLERLIDRYFNN